MQLSLFDDRDPSGNDTDILAQLRQSMDEMDEALSHPERDAETANNMHQRVDEKLDDVKQSGDDEDQTLPLRGIFRELWQDELKKRGY